TPVGGFRTVPVDASRPVPSGARLAWSGVRRCRSVAMDVEEFADFLLTPAAAAAPADAGAQALPAGRARAAWIPGAAGLQRVVLPGESEGPVRIAGGEPGERGDHFLDVREDRAVVGVEASVLAFEGVPAGPGSRLGLDANLDVPAVVAIQDGEPLGWRQAGQRLTDCVRARVVDPSSLRRPQNERRRRGDGRGWEGSGAHIVELDG